jgi:hypothetical protein
MMRKMEEKAEKDEREEDETNKGELRLETKMRPRSTKCN